jgi:adenosylmethionine-8-amino-7-oxononanoate aminotransferase
VIFAGFTHEPAVLLCERLKEVLPLAFSRFFFSDNGSTAVEVALKMAYQYWVNHGEKERTLFISFEGGYHGDTFGAMSVGKKSGFHDAFSHFLFSVKSLAYPDTWEDDRDVEEKERKTYKALETLLQDHGKKCAALIIEPLIQGASGMRMARASFVKRIVERIRKENILVIFDEVMTGFSRTGTLFALEQIGVSPDFLCLSKGLTGGFLPLALTVTTENVYSAFLDNSFSKAFAHGHSYTANPLGCAAALASLELLKEKATQESIQTIQNTHQEFLKKIKKTCACVTRIRNVGTIAAFDVEQRDPLFLQSLKEYAFSKGLIIRPLGKTVYLLPPYSTSESQLEYAYHTLQQYLYE